MVSLTEMARAPRQPTLVCLNLCSLRQPRICISTASCHIHVHAHVHAHVRVHVHVYVHVHVHVHRDSHLAGAGILVVGFCSLVTQLLGLSTIPQHWCFSAKCYESWKAAPCD